jgi:hypothetical protein
LQPQTPPGNSTLLPSSREGISAPGEYWFFELVIVAEFELIGLGHDQFLIRVSENSFLLQSIGASPDGLHGQSQKT